MKISFFVRMALWSLCVYILVACGQQPKQQSNISSNYFVQKPATATVPDSIETIGATVYVCNSSGAKKYHYKESCRGLSNCKHEVVTMEREVAEKRGLGVCGWED